MLEHDKVFEIKGFAIRKKIISEFLEENNKGYSQGELTRVLFKRLEYATMKSARVSVGKMLSELEVENVAYFESKMPSKGSIAMKVWYYNGRRENKLSEVPSEES